MPTWPSVRTDALRPTMQPVEVSTWAAVLSRRSNPLDASTDIDRERAAQFRSPCDADDFVAAHVLTSELGKCAQSAVVVELQGDVEVLLPQQPLHRLQVVPLLAA